MVITQMTVTEVEAKKTNLETELTTALAAAKVLEPATPEFDEAYGRYLTAKAAIAKIPDEIASAKLAENADAIKSASATVAEGITQLLEGLKVAELLGKPVIALAYHRAVNADGTISTGVNFNPTVHIKASGPKVAKEAKGAGHTMIVGPDGARLSLTKFVLTNATDAEKASPEFKYPHTRVDSRPKFDAFVASHNLTGYTYETPTTA